ncbi:hypothetical protein GCM10011507_19280 [Edaphobacter acidisoli]|uniref:Uncharacterized protein n=1 Tax=Edaphobacter acidisoli TaxID=2040573 RepID=A0A916RTA4_9BACT|nr:hypothetical protein [Edaphobacter acidisoli]GGA67962.1 hypothetical protein GCM10011507_19280 [Edaphobacter acidisoli]
MRLPFPERVSPFHAAMFAALLCFVQILEGTSPAFSLCCFLFIFVATVAFNVAGGFTRPSGSYIFFYAVLTVIFGLVWKAILGEPADSNLAAPQLTIEVFLGGICSMLAAVYISRRLTTKKPILGVMIEPARMFNATMGCMLVGTLITVLIIIFPPKDGTVLSAVRQVNSFLPMALIIGVIYQIRKTGGRSTLNFPVVLCFTVIFAYGLLGFSKEGMLTPFLCWLIGASSMRYRISFIQIVFGICIGIFTFQFLVPYSQYGRNFRGATFSDNLSSVVTELSELGDVRKQYHEQEAATGEEQAVHYFNTPQGFFDRLQMVAMDGALINVTAQGHVFGLSPIGAGFANLVPHFLWANKPRLHYGDIYADEIGGILAEDDTTTGISFSPSGEAFHLARWLGVLVVAPVLWIMLFTLYDSLCGDTREAPWGLVAILLLAHLAPEGGLLGVIYMLGYGTVALVFAAVVASYVMPILGTLIAGPERLTFRRVPRARSAVARSSLSSSGR